MIEKKSLAARKGDAYFHAVLALQQRIFSFVLKKPFQFLFVLLGCLHLIGGPYSLVQVYAWSTMIMDYSRDEGLLKAAQDTFSGEKPCELCCKIKEAKKEPQDKSPVSPLSSASAKLLKEVLPFGEIVLPSAPHALFVIPPVFAEPCHLMGILPASPPVPPPDAC